MSQNTEKANRTDDNERVTIARLAESILAEGKAETKEQAKAMARLEIAKLKAAKAKETLKAIDEAKKRLEREQARKERFAKSQNERKARTKLLIEAGGIVAKAGLMDWDAATLLGALVAAKSADDSVKARFRASGLKLLNAPKESPAASQAQTPSDASPSAGGEIAKSPEAPKTPMVFVAVETPGGKPSNEICQHLRESGLKWLDISYDRIASSNELMKSWQGHIPADKIDILQAYVESWGGILIRFN